MRTLKSSKDIKTQTNSTTEQNNVYPPSKKLKLKTKRMNEHKASKTSLYNTLLLITFVAVSAEWLDWRLVY